MKHLYFKSLQIGGEKKKIKIIIKQIKNSKEYINKHNHETL
jgi:hypothetical protein